MGISAERLRGRVKDDFLASIVVFLVALPLCMGIAIASGAPPAAGLITGIVGGIVVGAIAGAPLQVSGPAAGLSVIVWQILREQSAEALGIMILLAGFIQFSAGLVRLGQVFRAVAPAVIHGMLAGIGVLIFASQFHMMVDDVPRGTGIENLVAIPIAIWKGIIPLSDKSAHHQAAVVGVVTILTMIAWKPLTRPPFQFIPAPLVAIVFGSGLAAWLHLPVNRVDVPAHLWEAVQLPTLGSPALFLDKTVLIGALTIAVVASAETLLCATAVDQLQNGPRTRYDRELAAQGVGNMICGLLGALPMTGVIVRSGANVDAGAKTRLSAVLHGVWLLIFVVLLPGVLRHIPTSALAAMLVYTGCKLMNPKAVKALWRFGKSEVAIYAVTLVGIVAFDLLTGVLAGVGLALVKLLYTFSHLRIDVSDEVEANRTIMHLNGAATFLRLPRLATALETVRPNGELHVHFDELTYVDHACLDLLVNWEKQHQANGGRLVLDWESLTARFRQAEPSAAMSRGERTNPPVNHHAQDQATPPDSDDASRSTEPTDAAAEHARR